MTNNHVIPSADIARNPNTKAEFNYQLPFNGSVPSNSVRYDLDPDGQFETCKELDYTLVAVKTDVAGKMPPVNSWGRLQLNPHADPVYAEHVVIVQHPNGGPKQIALTGSAVMQTRPPYLHYSTDTMPGSSGSPVFNDLWQVIAIHHAAGPSLKTASGTKHSNEGILISAIDTNLGSSWPK
jgi:endonuclease G, mitochondrial